MAQLPLPRSVATVLWPGHVTVSVCVLGSLPRGLYARSRGVQGSHRKRWAPPSGGRQLPFDPPRGF